MLNLTTEWGYHHACTQKLSMVITANPISLTTLKTTVFQAEDRKHRGVKLYICKNLLCNESWKFWLRILLFFLWTWCYCNTCVTTSGFRDSVLSFAKDYSSDRVYTAVTVLDYAIILFCIHCFIIWYALCYFSSTYSVIFVNNLLCTDKIWLLKWVAASSKSIALGLESSCLKGVT